MGRSKSRSRSRNRHRRRSEKSPTSHSRSRSRSYSHEHKIREMERKRSRRKINRSISPDNRNIKDKRSSTDKKDDAKSIKDVKPKEEELLSLDDPKLQNLDPEEQMKMLLGFGDFDTTKGKKVEGNDVCGVRKIKEREYRQYMMPKYHIRKTKQAIGE